MSALHAESSPPPSTTPAACSPPLAACRPPCFKVGGPAPPLLPAEDLLSEAVHAAYMQRLVQPNDYVVVVMSHRGSMAVKVSVCVGRRRSVRWMRVCASPVPAAVAQAPSPLQGLVCVSQSRN